MEFWNKWACGGCFAYDLHCFQILNGKWVEKLGLCHLTEWIDIYPPNINILQSHINRYQGKDMSESHLNGFMTGWEQVACVRLDCSHGYLTRVLRACHLQHLGKAPMFYSGVLTYIRTQQPGLQHGGDAATYLVYWTLTKLKPREDVIMNIHNSYYGCCLTLAFPVYMSFRAGSLYWSFEWLL